MNFENALTALKNGQRVANEGWNGKNMYIEMQRPDEHSKMGMPYLYIHLACGKNVPWLASQYDLLCENWEIL